MAGHESGSLSTAVNLLESAASSYLRSARHQPVRWHGWGEDAFQRALAEDKPILLDIGAVWCHWCHVMDRESYEDAGLASIVNEHFVAIKVDRDERPDVDARYQAAVSAISGQGGWPLTAFLTPAGEPYFGGTYFPADERYGRPGFSRVLLTMAAVWRNQREEALESAASVMAAVEQNENFSGGGGELSRALVEKIVESMVKQFDARHGGFGSQPKFPHSGAIDLLLEEAARSGREDLRTIALTTLQRMSSGGVYDQLAGGFHRYSVDERWVVPHFEKMLYDNTELLRNYVHAYQSFGQPEMAEVAREIVGWLDAEMTDRQRGGFYSSQDADVGLEDDGDYFTWTRAEAMAVLTAEEWAVAGRYWDIGDLGDMQHDPAKNVLHRKHSLAEVARGAGMTDEAAAERVASARRKLLEARGKRTAPFTDRTIYTGWNGMAITAYLEAARVLGLNEPRAFALRTLDRVLAEAWDGDRELRHVVAYGEFSGLPQSVAAGNLDDYAFTVHACVDGWLATGEMRYYRAGMTLAETMVELFFERSEGGTAGAFVDTALQGGEKLAALSVRRKPLQDAPTPAGNPTAAAALLRLEGLSGRNDFREVASMALGEFAGIVEHFGLYAGSYALALNRLLLDPVQVVVAGSGALADKLEAVALGRFAVDRTVVRLTPVQVTAENLPPALAETVAAPAGTAGTSAWAMVCKGRSCVAPVSDVGALRELLIASL